MLVAFRFLTFFTLVASRIIAEGVPESQTRAFNKAAQDKGVGIIGPATVGGIKVRDSKSFPRFRVRMCCLNPRFSLL